MALQAQGGDKMAVRIKPVQPTEIKDKRIIREVIEQIHKPIPPEVYERHRKLGEYIDRMIRYEPEN
jgi:hypothetical protein